jgi:hypothetical protein
LPAFFLDFLLFINWPLSTLWWIMALSAFRLGHARASGTAAERVPAAPRSAEWLPTGRTE